MPLAHDPISPSILVDAAVDEEDAWSADSEDSTEDAAIEVAPSLTSAKVVAETDRR